MPLKIDIEILSSDEAVIRCGESEVVVNGDLRPIAFQSAARKMLARIRQAEEYAQLKSDPWKWKCMTWMGLLANRKKSSGRKKHRKRVKSWAATIERFQSRIATLVKASNATEWERWAETKRSNLKRKTKGQTIAVKVASVVRVSAVQMCFVWS